MTRKQFILSSLTGLGLLAGGGAAYFVNRPEFGRSPHGARLTKMHESPHYRNGQFHNLTPVTVMSEKEGEKENRLVATAKFLFGDKTELMPKYVMLTMDPSLHELNETDDVAIWLGHSTFFLQLAGYRILIDPVFSGYASPLPFINEVFYGTNVFHAEDIPDIDYLVISHDHWDHLDYPTVMSLKDKINSIICPLGVGEYFEQWGFNGEILHEEDWNTAIKLSDDLTVHFLPSQHFSGRFLKQNPTQWAGFAFVTPKRKVYYSGDGGYGDHFKAIGEKFGGFDLAIMENGQYNLAWHPIHMLPEETAAAAVDVKAKLVIGAHNSKFALARHPWQEPMVSLTAASRGKSYRLLTPMIGERVYLDLPDATYPWWEKLL